MRLALIWQIHRNNKDVEEHPEQDTNMKITVTSRKWFEWFKGTPEEKNMLDSYKIISIQSSCGQDTEPPFSEALINHPHLLRLTFDNVSGEHEAFCASTNAVLFDEAMAGQILRFVDDDSMPVLIHCDDTLMRSGAVGQVLDWYFNCWLRRNREDHRFFLRSHHVIPNPLVLSKMMDELGFGEDSRRKYA